MVEWRSPLPLACLPTGQYPQEVGRTSLQGIKAVPARLRIEALRRVDTLSLSPSP